MNRLQPAGLKQDHTGRMYIQRMNGRADDIECGMSPPLKTMASVDLIGHVWDWQDGIGYVAQPCVRGCSACGFQQE